MKLKYISFFLLPLLLTSCRDNNTIDYSKMNLLLLPSGAPTITMYQTICDNKDNDENVRIETTTSNIPSQFAADNFKYIIFDVNNGLIQANKSGKYTFLKLLTGGNFHLVRLASENEYPTNEDYILGFGTDAQIPNKAYNKLYPDAPFDYSFTDGVSALLGVLKTINADCTIGDNSNIDKNEKIDWVFIAQPALFNLINSEGNFKDLYNPQYDYEVRKLFNEKFPEFDYIAQAGLFVNTSYYENNKEEVEEFLNSVNTQLDNAINHPDIVANTMDSFSSDLKVQQNKFGFNKNIVLNLQKDGTNQFGVVDPNYEFNEEDLVNFNNFLNS